MHNTFIIFINLEVKLMVKLTLLFEFRERKEGSKYLTVRSTTGNYDIYPSGRKENQGDNKNIKNINKTQCS